MEIQCAYGVMVSDLQFEPTNEVDAVDLKRIIDIMDDSEFVEYLESYEYNSDLRDKLEYIFYDLRDGSTKRAFGYKLSVLCENDESLFDIRKDLRTAFASAVIDYDKDISKYGYLEEDIYLLFDKYFTKDKFHYLEAFDV